MNLDMNEILKNNMFTNLKADVRMFKLIGFWKPILEAITNSLQANAKNIVLSFSLESEILDIQKIIGLTIKDDGDGFTERNKERFMCLKTENILGKEEDKTKDGCKGMGRLSYLKVFKNVKYESYTHNEKISFTFNEDFTHNSIKTEKYAGVEKGVTAVFENLTSNILKVGDKGKKKGQIISDKRPIYNPQEIKEIILNHLLPMLYFKVKNNLEFKISIDSKTSIEPKDIPTFINHTPFILKDNNNDEEFQFDLFYNVSDSNIPEGVLNDYYCANNRAVCKFSEKNIHIANIPKKNITFLLLSRFFDMDNIVNIERYDFNIKPRERDLEIPFNWDEDINPPLKKQIIEILNKEIEGFSKKSEDKKREIIKKRPYLASYILQNNTIGIFDTEEEIKVAQKRFNSDRNDCLDLIDKNKVLNEEERGKVKTMVSLELSEYMWLRYKILQEMQQLLQNKEANEDKIHNLFLPKGKKLDNDTLLIENLHHNNLWLIDDRFMSYRYAFSDAKISEIKKTIRDNSETLADKKEPDFAVFFDNLFSDNSVNDLRAIAIELKPFSLNYDGNKKGITQLVDYRRAFFKSTKIKEKWYYLITNVDAEFEDYLTGEGGLGYEVIFSSSGKVFLDTKNRTYVMPIETLLNECEKRHKLFFEILENNTSINSPKPSVITHQIPSHS